MAVRASTTDRALAALVRERQDLTNEWRWRDRLIITSLSRALHSRDRAFEEEQNQRLGRIEDRITKVDERLTKGFPEYAAFVNPEPLSVADVQTLLKEDEALVLFLDTPKRDPIAEETFIWVVTKTSSRWVRSDLGSDALTERVAALRCGLDEEQWAAATDAKRCGERLGLTEAPEPFRPLPFDLGKARELYVSLFGQIEDLIKDKRLLIVPSGPLTSLPFSVLVTKQPDIALPATFEGYRNVAWLGRTHALAVLPSVASLKALRAIAVKGQKAALDYVGYGNPLLTGDGSSCPTTQAPDQHCPLIDSAGQQQVQTPGPEAASRATVGGRRGRRSANPDALFAKGASQEAVLEQVRALCPLPETAYEIKCVAEHFKDNARLIRLGAEATKTDIQALSKSGTLARYRIVHFATHGLVSGDVEIMTKRQGEPALVLTPKDANDDGLLLASEVALLKLNADWVVLSACNTAAGDKLGAQALSGLARAFFYAQAKALLVSHWPVYSDAAVQLTTRAFAQLDQDPNIGRAEALQRAMTQLMDNPNQIDNPHPAVWAPFTLVGDGYRE